MREFGWSEKLTTPVKLFFKNSARHLLFDLAREGKIVKQEESSQGIFCIAHLTALQKSKWAEHMI